MISSNRISDFFIFSNLYVALPVSALALSSFYLMHESVNWVPIAFIYLATLALYNIHRLVGIHQIPQSELGTRHTWSLKNLVFVKILIAIGIVGMLGLAFWLSLEQIIILAIPAAIASGYTLPIYKSGSKIWRFRDIPFLKIWLVSFTVSFITTYFPLSSSMPLSWLNSPEVHWLFISRVFFIFAITIPFDVRDLKFDTPGKINTVPMLFGVQKSKQVALLCLLLFSGISFWLFRFNTSASFALLLSALIAGWIINACEEDSNEYYFSFFAEGTMLIQFGLVYLAR